MNLIAILTGILIAVCAGVILLAFGAIGWLFKQFFDMAKDINALHEAKRQMNERLSHLEEKS
jgi:TM2 domain-containing membrane protein YozV